MDQELDQQIVATFANIAEALVARQILETAGVPCRMTDDAQLPNALYGMPGSIGRSAAIWVLAADVERARTLLAEMEDASGIDDAELAAEALSAKQPAPEKASGKGIPRARLIAFLVLVAVGAAVALIVQLR